MFDIWFYSLISVIIVSMISLIGLFSIPIQTEKLKKLIIYFISFSAGALFGDAFIHMLPEVVARFGFRIEISFYLIFGILISFILEKFIHWRHCHMPITKTHIHRFAYMNLFGDSVHNFIDGLTIGASYLVNIHVGIATTIAVVLHEIPQEIGDFGVLIHGGFSKKKALLYNFLTALTSILGAVIVLLIGSYINNINMFLIPFAAGGFIYIAGSDLIPELHKEAKIKESILQTLTFILGVGVMFSLLFL